jgi:excisionase family DNA binding protein
MATTEKLLSPAELAAYLDIPIQTLYQYNFEGSGPRYSKVGRHCRYRMSDVQAWLDAHVGPKCTKA